MKNNFLIVEFIVNKCKHTIDQKYFEKLRSHPLQKGLDLHLVIASLFLCFIHSKALHTDKASRILATYLPTFLARYSCKGVGVMRTLLEPDTSAYLQPTNCAVYVHWTMEVSWLSETHFFTR